MSTSTPNIGLTLPIGVEKVSRAIINANMTKIDTAFGNMNRATMREVPFTIAVADWSGSGSSWSATYLTDYVTSTSKEILTYTSSLRTAKAEDIDANKKSGGGGIVFTTTKKPIASISGSIYVWDSDDGKIPVIIEGTVTPVENGGTGASSVAGAKNNLGISAVESSVQSLSEQLALQDLSSTGITRETILGSGGSLYLYRIGKIVILTFANIGVSSAITTTDTKIATLSVPAVRNVFSIAKSINNDDVFFFVNTSGGLYISGITGAPANKALYGTIVYFTN